MEVPAIKPEAHPQGPYSGTREPTHASCPLTSNMNAVVLTHIHAN